MDEEEEVIVFWRDGSRVLEEEVFMKYPYNLARWPMKTTKFKMKVYLLLITYLLFSITSCSPAKPSQKISEPI